ncbi:PREDICTED: proline-, glutamic acid- and leucine-rich protein 1 [Ipomoea nil]|uniref:proline-, glutamic acid- and leucine-rich protein 1 n=1 Tax=Ipomoea nil TaxID=35883 RepID=UPI0009018B26|nr:PREDICTED: proline-, glutamic acid- and leucine-rich protein 1 [Ipomoea nil]XP_019181832.1 PREDICTED: proline-, glutamic acid- and leucine-rich protein 1 [Ipomoea nil]XP_019181833.1 PREDICTED: proline-, glutamic acid- and leucine-rich protein 1 [Ipomoea nil]XP_019181834.1 PREDICTED: proline-, glutamic acid- and leucine-rich protein 1 [Ipomoea nil]
MAASDHIQGMNDIALKPQLLRSLLSEYVPTEKHPFRRPSDLSFVVSVVKTHRLLSESAAPSVDQKLIDNWKSVVDAWFKRFLNLASSNMPDKCWAGICLLGVTCQECSSERFLASYSSWFIKLLSYIQSPADSHFVKAASCASISDLFTRLSGFTSAKKDGVSQATKVIQPVLKLLNEDTSDVVWEEAISLLCTVINVFPSSVQRCYDEVESAVVSKFMSGKCSQSMLRKLGNCLALLPKAKGDEDSWLLMMQKILLTINNQLNDVFQGLEPETRHNEAMRLLLSPGKDAPPPLGGQDTSRKILAETTNRLEHQLMSRISILMLCCSTMLTSTYPVQVAVPVHSLVDLTKRVLMVDGSASGLYSFMTTMKQELVLSELPVLHLGSLELITAIVKGLHSQLLPHAAGIIRLLTEYFQRCVLPEIRIKLYSIMKVLLLSMGVGIAVHLAEVVIDNATMDLNEGATSPGDHAKISVEAQPLTNQRKRKHANAMGAHEDQPDGNVTEVKVQQDSTLISVKIAALEALEALLTVGGSWRSESWRANVDNLLLAVAKSACQVGFSVEEKSIFLSGTPTDSWANFQLAALHALLASLVSPRLVRLANAAQCLVPVRPPHLAQGLELFRKGMQETGTRHSEFCAHALLTLEVLIHPRALPLIDHQSPIDCDGRNQRIMDGRKLGGQRQTVTFEIGTSRNGPDEQESEGDELHENWTRIENETEAPSSDLAKDKSNSIEPSDTMNDLSSKNLPCDDASAEKVSEGSQFREPAAASAAEHLVNRDNTTLDQQHSQEASKQPGEKSPVEAGTSAPIAGAENHARSGAFVSGSSASDPMESDTTPLAKSHSGLEKAAANDMLEGKDDGFYSALNKVSSSVSNSDSSGKEPMQESDDDDSESIPDIVDVEPDEDSE